MPPLNKKSFPHCWWCLVLVSGHRDHWRSLYACLWGYPRWRWKDLLPRLQLKGGFQWQLLCLALQENRQCGPVWVSAQSERFRGPSGRALFSDEGGFTFSEAPFEGTLHEDLKGASPSKGFKKLHLRWRAWRWRGLEGGFIFRRLEGGLIRNGLPRYIFYTCPNLM